MVADFLSDSESVILCDIFIFGMYVYLLYIFSFCIVAFDLIFFFCISIAYANKVYIN
jgi:hypothetical protein